MSWYSTCYTRRSGRNHEYIVILGMRAHVISWLTPRDHGIAHAVRVVVVVGTVNIW